MWLGSRRLRFRLDGLAAVARVAEAGEPRVAEPRVGGLLGLRLAAAGAPRALAAPAGGAPASLARLGPIQQQEAYHDTHGQ